MIRATLSSEDNQRVIIAPLMDAMYNDDLWISTIQKCVSGIIAAHHAQPHRVPGIGFDRTQ